MKIKKKKKLVTKSSMTYNYKKKKSSMTYRKSYHCALHTVYIHGSRPVYSKININMKQIYTHKYRYMMVLFEWLGYTRLEYSC